MLNYYRTDDRKISELSGPDTGCWVKLSEPSREECEIVAKRFEIDIADVRAALDDEEFTTFSGGQLHTDPCGYPIYGSQEQPYRIYDYPAWHYLEV